MYSASKAAMESYSDILRLEMAPFGVKVVTVISGAVETNMNSATSLAPSTLPAEDSIFKPAESNIAKPFIRDRMSVETYSQRVVNDILSGNTSRVWRGAFASRLWFATTFLPTSLVVSNLFCGRLRWRFV
jgi:short-subunit dehydrogenase